MRLISRFATSFLALVVLTTANANYSQYAAEGNIQFRLDAGSILPFGGFTPKTGWKIGSKDSLEVKTTTELKELKNKFSGTGYLAVSYGIAEGINLGGKFGVNLPRYNEISSVVKLPSFSVFAKYSHPVSDMFFATAIVSVGGERSIFGSISSTDSGVTLYKPVGNIEIACERIFSNNIVAGASYVLAASNDFFNLGEKKLFDGTNIIHSLILAVNYIL